MALYFPDIIENNNPDYPALDSDFLRGGTRSPVASLTDLYSLYPSKTELLKERATRVYVSGEDKYYVLINLANAGSSAGWAEDNFSNANLENVVYTTGDQTISGLKDFITRPTVNGTGVLLSGDSLGPSEITFTGDLKVSLSNNKTFGKYLNGQTIPASGKTPSEVIKLAIVEALAPSINFSSPTNIAFNQTSINNVLNASNTINSLDAFIQTGYIEWRRGGVGPWIHLTGNTGSSFSFTHSLTDSAFNVSGFNYKYTVNDTAGGTDNREITITPAPYVAPSLTNVSIGSSPVDLGNISTTVSARINRNSPNVNLIEYQLQYRSVIGGVTSNWTNIGSISPSAPNQQDFSVVHNDSSLLNATSISYQVVVRDSYQSNIPLSLGTRSFLHRNSLGFSSSPALTTVNEIENLTSLNSALSDSKSRTVNSVTAGDNFTYYCYRAGAGDLIGITDGLEQFLGAFTKQPADIVGVNSFGASVSYRVYKSNAKNAFTNVNLIFS